MALTGILCAALLATGHVVDIRSDGSADSVQRAVARVRADRAAGRLDKAAPVTLRLAAGTYRQTAPIRLSADDSHLRFVGAGMDATLLSGGVELPRFTVGKDGVWTCRVPKGTRFDQLWVNGRRATRARSPNRDYFYMVQPHEDGKRAFYANPKDIAPIANLPAAALTNVVLHLFMSWQTGLAHLTSVDGRSGLVRGHQATGWYDYFKWKDYAPRYRLENFRAALDEAGEWFLDVETGLLSYLPRKGEVAAATRAVAPAVDRLLVASNVTDVVFANLAFECQGFLIPNSCGTEQAACRGVGAALELADAVQVRFEDAAIRHVSEYALWYRDGCHDGAVTRCLVEDLGAGGVRVGEVGKVDFARAPYNVTVADSVVRAGGRVFPGGIGLFVSHARDCVLEHNEIADFFYTGISVGWTWGYRPTVNRNNKIRFNHIHHIGQGVLSDMGGIYTLGRADGTEVVGNVIHDVDSYDFAGYGSSGLYTDEGSGNEVFASNLVYRCKTGPVHQHYGTNNVFRNNVFVMTGGREHMPPTHKIAVVRRSREEPHRTCSFFNNIFYWTNGEGALVGTFKTPAKGDDMVWRSNLYWCATPCPTNAFALGSWETWRAGGQDAGSFFGKPAFVDAAQDDYRLADETETRRIGFVPWDYSLAGVRGDAAWKRRATEAPMPRVTYARTPPAYRGIERFTTSFETCPKGRTPSALQLSLDKSVKDSFVRVTDGKARSGKQCLEVKDSPKCAQPFFPFFSLHVGAKTNERYRVKYSLCGDAKTDVYFELRDIETKPIGRSYVPFANVAVRGGKFIASGRSGGRRVARDLLPFAPGRWYDVDLVFDAADGTWSVTVASEKGETATASLDKLEDAAHVPTIALFCSNGREDSVVHYDDISFAEAAPSPVRLGYAGVLSLDDLDVSIQPMAPLVGWSGQVVPQGRPLREKAGQFKLPMRHGGVLPTGEKDPETVTFDGRLSTRTLPDGAVALDWSFRPDRDLPAEAFYISCSLPIARFGGGTAVVDGRSRVEMSEAFGTGRFDFMHRKIGRSIALKTPDGVERLRFDFPERVIAQMQDNRRWSSQTFSLRLHFNQFDNRRFVAGREYTFSCIVSGPRPFGFVEGKDVRITAGDDWVPLKPAAGIEEGSALDFTALRGTEAPAGKYGRVVCRGQHFEFEKLPGVAQRFYGVNVCFTANTPDLETARKFAREMAKMGYNAIRFHHHESSLVKPDGLTPDPEKMKLFDGLVAACIENGIYMTTDLFVSRRPITYRSVGIDRDGEFEMAEYKDVVQFHDGVYANFLAWTRNFLNHVNVYTGRRYADEPALAWLSFVNEGCVGNKGMGFMKRHPVVTERWRAWLAGRRAADPARYADIPDRIPDALNDMGNPHQAAFNYFLADAERSFARRVTAVLRDEIKCRALTTNMNGWHYTLANQVPRVQEYDYVDDHFYVDHPSWIDRPWNLPSRCQNRNPVKGSNLGAQGLVARRDLSRPFTITEYNFSAPGSFRGLGGIVCGSAAALQDWAGLWRFAWSHGVDGLVEPEKKQLGYFDMSGDPLSRAAERASICLFLRRDLPVLTNTYAVVQPPSAISAFNGTSPRNQVDWTWASWYAKFGGYVGERAPADATWSVKWPAAYRRTHAEVRRDILPGVPLKETPPAGDGHVRIDPNAGTFFLDTDRTSGGFAERGTIDGGALKATLSGAAATVWASTLDGKPFGETSRVLVTHLTDVQNTGARFADDERKILLYWGRLPHLMRKGRADVTLKLAAGDWKVWRLSASGRRLGEVPCVRTAEGLSFRAAVDAVPDDATYLYELVSGLYK